MVLMAASAMAQTWSAELQKRAEGGDVKAQYELGEVLFNGLGTEKKVIDGLTWYATSAGNGYAEAQYKTGFLCEVLTENYQQAAEWYKMAADQGHPAAQEQLAVLYLDGRGVEQNIPEAVRLLRACGEKADKNVQGMLGSIYYDGLGPIRRDMKEAARWYGMAAAQGDPNAEYLFGSGYYKGDEFVGGKKDPAASRSFLERYVAHFRQPDGKIVVEDADKKAVMSDVLRMLQALYRFGRGTAVDVEKANRLLEEAAQFGDPDAAAIARAIRK